MDELERMILQCDTDRAWYHERAERTKVDGYQIDALACAIRKRALLDARDAIIRGGRRE
jgi:hypothetical protein